MLHESHEPNAIEPGIDFTPIISSPPWRGAIAFALAEAGIVHFATGIADPTSYAIAALAGIIAYKRSQHTSLK
jgi:hypothetical protein